MEDFYDRFKNNLENQPEPEYEPRDWDKMAQLLDQQHPPVAGRWKRGALIAAALLFLFSNLGLALLLFQTNQHLIQSNNIQGVKDTIVIQKTIIQKDTIYIISESSTPPPAYRASQLTSSFTNKAPLLYSLSQMRQRFELHQHLIPSSSWAVLPRHSAEPKSSELPPYDSGLVSIQTPFLLDEIAQLNLLAPQIPKRTQTLPAFSELPEYTSIPISLFFEPKLVRVGMSTQLNGAYSSVSGPGLNMGMGAEANLLFPGHYGFEGGFFFNYLQLYPQGSADFNIYPQVEPNNPGDQFKHLNIKWSQLQYHLGILYEIPTQKKWNLQFGAGITARKLLNQRYNYEFIDNNGNEYYLLQERYDRDFGLNSLYFRTGVIRRLSNRWDLQSSLIYQHDFEQEHPHLEQFNELGLRVSFLYNFLR